MNAMYPKTSVYHNESSSFDRFFDTGSTKRIFYVTKTLQTFLVTVAAEITADDIPNDIGMTSLELTKFANALDEQFIKFLSARLRTKPYIM